MVRSHHTWHTTDSPIKLAGVLANDKKSWSLTPTFRSSCYMTHCVMNHKSWVTSRQFPRHNLAKKTVLTILYCICVFNSFKRIDQTHQAECDIRYQNWAFAKIGPLSVVACHMNTSLSSWNRVQLTSSYTWMNLKKSESELVRTLTSTVPVDLNKYTTGYNTLSLVLIIIEALIWLKLVNHNETQCSKIEHLMIPRVTDDEWSGLLMSHAGGRCASNHTSPSEMLL